MENENLADLIEAPAASPEGVSAPETTPAPSQEKDLVEAELERVEQKPKRSKREQLQYTKQRVEKQLAELDKSEGVDPEDDSRPLTVGDLRRLREEEAVETAINLAEDLDNEHERRLTKHYLENNIRSTGDAQQDFKLAYAMVTAVKNSQKAEEAQRAQRVRTVASAPSAPAREKSNEDLTPDEMKMMGKPFNMTKEEILAARQ